MEMKRPRKTRVEIEFAKDKAVQVSTERTAGSCAHSLDAERWTIHD